MCGRQKYDPIIPKSKDWPVVRLNRQRRAFMQAVIDQSTKSLLVHHGEDEALHTLLSKTLAMEEARIQRKSWKADPPDEQYFWKRVATYLSGKGNLPLPTVLKKIIKRYAFEIAGRFYSSHYRLAQQAIAYTLARLLHPVKLSGLHTPTQIQQRLQNKIHITGNITQLRQLARVGTIIMVPTHFSHLDSMLIAWVLRTLGLPPFIYGAGLNLFNSRFFAYFMEKVGTYKVDRRKKNLPYLTTLKAYSSLALQWGCHSLFYPGGTRSRSGAIEQNLKLGLLGTAIEAQQRNYEKHGRGACKLFVVPVVFNYPFVLEAPWLIKGHLATNTQSSLDGAQEDYSQMYNMLKLAANFLTKDSHISVSIGQAMDLLGNVVDEKGNSYNSQGELVDSYNDFCHKGADATSSSREERYTRQLGQAIVKAYYQSSCVLASQLIAYAAFELLKKKHANLTWKELLQLPAEALIIPYATLEHTFAQLRAVILQLHQAGKVQVEEYLKEGNIATMVKHGLENVGIYHAKKPLFQNKAGDITTQDLSTLLYYHNRLTGYDLEKHVE